MAKKKLVVVHGMGHHTEASVAKEVGEAFSYAFGLYDSLRGKSFAQEFDLSVVEYNSFFEDYRQVLQLNADNVLTALNRLTGDFPPIPSLTAEIARLDGSVREDNFFNSHWLNKSTNIFSTQAS